MFTRKIIILFILCIAVFSWSTALASTGNIDPKVEKVFSTFLVKLERKLKGNINSKEKFLNKLDQKLIYILENKSLNTEKQKLIHDILLLNREALFSITYNKMQEQGRQVIDSQSISKNFKNKSYTKENIILEQGIWYTYNYTTFLSFPQGSNPTVRDLEFNDINVNTDIITLKENGNIAFVNNYKKVKLISDVLIFGTPDKYNLLKEIKDDKKSLNYETDQYFLNLKNTTLELTKGLKSDGKIKVIYDYILNNVSYTKNIDLTDKKIFSGIDTYKNKEGVCEGYTKQFLYMLNFAGIGNSEVMRGFVIDAQDFPKIGHAWVKIGNDYYDPTFDDPIGLTQTREFTDYKYYKLPRDLFYTNRYNENDITDVIKTLSKNEITTLINNNLSRVLTKYKTGNYNLLKPLVFKDQNDLDVNSDITVENLKDIIPYYPVQNFTFKMDGKIKSIKTLNYFTVHDSNIEAILKQLNYELNDYYLFQWDLGNGNFDYRLAYNIEFH